MWPFKDGRWKQQIEINREQIQFNKDANESMANLLKTNELLRERLARLEARTAHREGEATP